MHSTPGIQGYAQSTERFIESSLALDFSKVCKDFMEYLPPTPARILDAGAGVGQNAAALADMGYRVTAVEPTPEFLDVAKARFSTRSVTWLSGSLPMLDELEATACFDFILVDGVWHHLSKSERSQSLAKFASILSRRGRCAISLRNGPAGLGTCVYPTDVDETIEQAVRHGFDCIFSVQNQPSLMPNKEGVTWARLVFEKRNR